MYSRGKSGRKKFRAGHDDYKYEKQKGKNKRWQNANSDFRCRQCRQMVFVETAIGTMQRNHCNHCLWSLHIDTKPGNRASTCHARMEPVGLTFKHSGRGKYGGAQTGDVMLVHFCKSCECVNINRIAGDDPCHLITDVFEKSLVMDKYLKTMITESGIRLLEKEDEAALHIALFGKKAG